MFAFVGDTVLDPFLGSGTTALAAKNLGRNSVGYEVNQEFLPMIREKVLGDQHQMFGEATLDVSTQGQIGLDSSAEIAKLLRPHQVRQKSRPKIIAVRFSN